jgi:ABC-2 type transport system permease protein
VIGLIRAEFRKLLTTQVWFWLLLASIAITALGVIGPIASANGQFELQSRVHDILESANSAGIAVFVLGVLSVTTEFRYQTITPTVLVTPSRWALITGKLITAAVTGIVYALICTIITLAVALPWLAGEGIDSPLSGNSGALASGFVVVALYSLVGLGAGALMKNQIVAVSVGLIFLLVLQNLVVVIPGVKHVYPYLPSGLSNAITTATSGDRTVNGVNLLPIWGGVVGFIIWGVGMALLGAGLTMNRDIT